MRIVNPAEKKPRVTVIFGEENVDLIDYYSKNSYFIINCVMMEKSKKYIFKYTKMRIFASPTQEMK